MNDINDLDYTVNAIFNNNGTKKYQRIEEVTTKSTNCTPIRNTRRTKQKPKGMKNLAKKAIIFVALGAGLVVGIHEFKETTTLLDNTLNIRSSIGSVVSENTNTYGYNANEERPYWDYNIANIAKDVLDENKEYDIDTRIYGCYSHLNDYRKHDYMDSIFRSMSKLISANPEGYTEDEIKACLHSTFDEYLDSKGITLEDYEDLMEKVIKAYAKEDKTESEIQDLLSKLNGGSR